MFSFFVASCLALLLFLAEKPLPLYIGNGSLKEPPGPTATFQGTSRNHPEAPKEPQGPPKSSQGATRDSPGAPRDPPGSTQELPRSTQGPPRSTQGAPGSTQELPRSPQGPPRSTQESLFLPSGRLPAPRITSRMHISHYLVACFRFFICLLVRNESPPKSPTQGAPKSPPRRPKVPQEAPQTSPRRPTRPPSFSRGA